MAEPIDASTFDLAAYRADLEANAATDPVKRVSLMFLNAMSHHDPLAQAYRVLKNKPGTCNIIFVFDNKKTGKQYATKLVIDQTNISNTTVEAFPADPKEEVVNIPLSSISADILAGNTVSFEETVKDIIVNGPPEPTEPEPTEPEPVLTTSTLVFTSNTAAPETGESVLGALRVVNIDQNDPDSNFITAVVGVSKWEAGDTKNGLLSVDLSSIPQDATIVSANLTMVSALPSSNGDDTYTVGLYRLKKQFDSFAATWNNADTDPVTPWQTPGAIGTEDIEYIPIATKGIGVAADIEHSFDITQMVTEWYNGTHPNYGLLLERQDVFEHTVPNTYVGQQRSFYSHSGVDGKRPKLTVVFEHYTIPETPDENPDPDPVLTPYDVVISSNTTPSVPDQILPGTFNSVSISKVTPTEPINSASLEVTKWDQNDHVNSLLKFDVSSIPQGAVVTSAVLRMVTKSPNNNTDANYAVGVYRLKKDADFDTATWQSANPANTVAWQTPGGMGVEDIEHWPAAVTPVPQPTGSVCLFDITQLVKDWVDGTHPNYGVLLERQDVFEHASYTAYIGIARTFHSETGTDGSRPELIITYEI